MLGQLGVLRVRTGRFKGVLRVPFTSVKGVVRVFLKLFMGV